MFIIPEQFPEQFYSRTVSRTVLFPNSFPNSLIFRLDDVKWQGDCIAVLGRALVRAPYTTDSVEPLGESPKDSAVIQAMDHVRKIVSFVLAFTMIGCYSVCISLIILRCQVPKWEFLVGVKVHLYGVLFFYVFSH